jgi:hypothetical protein
MDCPATTIDGINGPLRNLVDGKKCIMVVNVATK